MDVVGKLGPRSRFVIGGALNTTVTYVIYLFLHAFIGYQWAFLAAYLLGIALSYLFNALIVFRAKPNLTSAMTFPLIYVVQYSASGGLLALLVERMRIDERIAPLLVAVAVMPLTYLLMRYMFKATTSTRS